MAQFDIQYAQGVPDVVRQPRANMNVDTGAGQIGNAVAQFGNNLNGIAQKYRQADNALEFSTMKRRYDEFGSAAMSGLQNVSDPVEAQKIIDQYQKDVSSLQSKNGEVNQEFQIHVNDTATRWTDAFAGTIEKNKVKQLNDEFDANYQGYLEQGDYAGANELLDNLTVAGSITKTKADDRRKTFFGDTLLAQADRLINTGDAASLKRAEGIIENMPKLTAKDGKPIQFTGQQIETMDALRTNLYATQNRVNGALKVQQDKEQWELYKKSEDGTLTQSMLDKSVISADEKRQIWSNYQTAQYQKAKAGISSLEEGDPSVLANLNAIIDLAPEKINEAGIYAATQNGLGTKHVTGLVDRYRKNIADKDPVDKKYKAQLASLYEAKLFGEKIKPETSDAYMKVQGELDTFLSTKPTDEQAQKYFSELIRKKVRGGWISSIYNSDLFLATASPTRFLYREYKKRMSPNPPAIKTNTPPKEYPDATWDVQNNMWVVVRNGRKMGVQ